MSNILNQEPEAHGLIKFKTSFGDLDIQLFTKQCPKATQNFLQLCLDGYYHGSTFERVERDFIAIGGGQPSFEEESEFLNYYPDEFHSRLRFNRRGLLASANTKKDQNSAKFFFTLAATPELQGKHTIFGRLKSNSVYSLADLNDIQVDKDFCPYSRQEITEIIVIDNPWPHLKPNAKHSEYLTSKRKKDTPGKTNDDEQAYDPLLKPKLDPAKIKKLSFGEYSEDEDQDEGLRPIKALAKEVSLKKDVNVGNLSPPIEVENSGNDVKEEQAQDTNGDDKVLDSKEERLREIRAKIQQLKEQAFGGLLNSKTLSEKRSGENSEQAESYIKSTSLESEIKSITVPKKGSRKREQETLERLREFKKKLKESAGEMKEITEKSGREREEFQPDKLEMSDELAELAELDKVDGDDWLRHKFEADDEEVRLAKDANTKSDDWYSIEDPRNRIYNRSRHRRDDSCHDHRHKSRSRREDSASRHEREKRRHDLASHHSR